MPLSQNPHQNAMTFTSADCRRTRMRTCSVRSSCAGRLWRRKASQNSCCNPTQVPSFGHVTSGRCLSGVLLPPLSGEVKTLQHLHARVCARSGTCQMWDHNSATTDRHVCRQCKTMRAVREAVAAGLHSWPCLMQCDHAEHC